jgi:hypothetical protein
MHGPSGSHTQPPPFPHANAEEWALFYASRGWKVFPLHSVNGGRCSCGNPDCGSPGKHPRTEHGFNDASIQPQQIRDWWRRWPDANIGIATGAVSGIVVLDVDPRNGGDASDVKLQNEFPEAFANLFKVRSGSGGTHRYFQHPGRDVLCRANFRPGIDVRGDGGFVVAPPSSHVKGRYRFLRDNGFVLPPLHPALCDLICPKAQALAADGQGCKSKIEVESLAGRNEIKALIRDGWPKGQRSEATFAASRAMTKTGHNDEEIIPVLVDPTNRFAEKSREQGTARLNGKPTEALQETDRAYAPVTSSDTAVLSRPDSEIQPLLPEPSPQPSGSLSPEINGNASAADPLSGQHQEPAAKEIAAKQGWQKHAIAADQLQRETYAPISFVVPDLIPAEGVTLICSKPKMGKSWLALDLAIAVTTGRYLLGAVTPTRGDVLYLALEDSHRRLQQRMTKLLESSAGGWPPELTLAIDWRRTNEGGLDDMRDWYRSAKKPRLIVVDVLTKIRPPPKSNKSVYENDYEAISGLHRLAMELGIAIVIIHHTRKLAAEDAMDTVSGSFGLVGAADTIIVIERRSQGTILDVRGRDVDSLELAIRFDKDTCRWTLLGDAREVHRSDERTRVLNVLAAVGGPLGPREIMAATGRTDDSNAVYQLLFKMARTGDIVKVGRGQYTLSPPPGKDDKDGKNDNQDGKDDNEIR